MDSLRRFFARVVTGNSGQLYLVSGEDVVGPKAADYWANTAAQLANNFSDDQYLLVADSVETRRALIALVALKNPSAAMTLAKAVVVAPADAPEKAFADGQVFLTPVQVMPSVKRLLDRSSGVTLYAGAATPVADAGTKLVLRLALALLRKLFEDFPLKKAEWNLIDRAARAVAEAA